MSDTDSNGARPVARAIRCLVPASAGPGAASFNARLAGELRRPVDPGEIRFKLLRETDGGAEIASYIDARLVIARLNLLCPGRWTARHFPLPLGMRVTMPGPEGHQVPARRAGAGKPPVPDATIYVVCELSVCGQLFTDVGEGADPKAAVSDSLKRAAVRVGIGECLYAFRIPTLYAQAREEDSNRPESLGLARCLGLGIEAATLRRQRAGERTRLVIDRASRAGLVRLYELWLTERGRAGFGEPLAHGPAGEGDQEGTALGEVEEGSCEPPEPVEDAPASAAPAGRTRIAFGTQGQAAANQAPAEQNGAAGAQEATRVGGQATATDSALTVIAAAAARIPDRVDAATIAALGALLAERPPQETPRALPRGPEFVAELVEAIELVVAAGWSAERLGEVLERADASDLRPADRRTRFLGFLRAAASPAA